MKKLKLITAAIVLALGIGAVAVSVFSSADSNKIVVANPDGN